MKPAALHEPSVPPAHRIARRVPDRRLGKERRASTRMPVPRTPHRRLHDGADFKGPAK